MWSLYLLLMSFCIKGSSCLECYSCYVKPPPRAPGSATPEYETLCSTFDKSDKYLVNCTLSTFCQTRTFRLQHRQGSSVEEVVIAERGCAMQAYTYQTMVRGNWRTITTIMEETYTTGCVTDNEWAGSLASNTEYCYCDTDRCNQEMVDNGQYYSSEKQINETQNGIQDSQYSLEQQKSNNYSWYGYDRKHGSMQSGCGRIQFAGWLVVLLMTMGCSCISMTMLAVWIQLMLRQLTDV